MKILIFRLISNKYQFQHGGLGMQRIAYFNVKVNRNNHMKLILRVQVYSWRIDI